MRVFLWVNPHAEEAPQTANCILLSIEEFLLIYILQDIKTSVNKSDALPTKPPDIPLLKP